MLTLHDVPDEVIRRRYYFPFQTGEEPNHFAAARYLGGEAYIDTWVCDHTCYHSNLRHFYLLPHRGARSAQPMQLPGDPVRAGTFTCVDCQNGTCPVP